MLDSEIGDDQGRGPLINSTVDVKTYTVYVRTFYDEANNIGSLTLFNQPNTV